MIRIIEYTPPIYSPELKEAINKLTEVVQKEIAESKLNCFEAVYLLRWITQDIDEVLADSFDDELLKRVDAQNEEMEQIRMEMLDQVKFEVEKKFNTLMKEDKNDKKSE